MGHIAWPLPLRQAIKILMLSCITGTAPYRNPTQLALFVLISFLELRKKQDF
jgi:hypothetical protein